MLDDDDLVGAPHRGEAVGDDHRGAPVEEAVERALDQDLRRPVDVRGRLVEDQDARVGEQGARDRDQLALPGREPGASLAHVVVEAALEARDDAVDADRGRGARDVLVARVGLREADVVGDRAGEQERVLEHDPELAPVRAELDRAQVDPVDAHGALVRVVEARDQLRERRLAAARLADEREAAARRHAQVDPVQHRLVAVGEGDVVDLEQAVDPRQLPRPVLVVDLGLGVEHRGDLLHRRARRLHLPVEVGELLERLEDEREQADRGDQRADLERAVLVGVGAEAEHRDARDRAEELDAREEERVEPLRVVVRDEVLPVQVVELGAEVRLAVVRLDHRHPRNRLRELGGDRRDPLAHAQERAVRAQLEPARQHDRRRQDHERDEAEPPVEDEEADHRAEQGEAVRDEGRQALREHVRDGVDVRGEARDDPARLLLAEVAQRERGEVAEQVAADVEHDPLADPGEAAGEVGAEPPGGRVDRDVGDHDHRQARHVVLLDPVVDGVADEQPAADLTGRRDRCGAHQHGDAPVPALEVAAQAREPDARPMLQRLRLRTGVRTGPRPRSGPAACRPRRSGRRRAPRRGRPARRWRAAASRRAPSAPRAPAAGPA